MLFQEGETMGRGVLRGFIWCPLKACVWSLDCSPQGSPYCGEVYRSPGKGLGSPPPLGGSALGSAWTRRTAGCRSCVSAHCGSSHLTASDCAFRWACGLLVCDCCSCFFGPVYGRIDRHIDLSPLIVQVVFI